MQFENKFIFLEIIFIMFFSFNPFKCGIFMMYKDPTFAFSRVVYPIG